MGTIKSGILGGFSGKVGGVVGTSWKGIAVMKALPQSVANPRTNAQVAQRENMSAMVTTAGRLLGNYVRPLWDRFAQGMSGYNAFVQANIYLFTGGVMYDVDMFVLSKGKMAATTPVIPTVHAGDTQIIITYSNAITDSFQQSTDTIYCAARLATSDTWGLMATTATRLGGTITINFSEPLPLNETVHVYLSARRADGTVVSDTGHAAKVVVA